MRRKQKRFASIVWAKWNKWMLCRVADVAEIGPMICLGCGHVWYLHLIVSINSFYIANISTRSRSCAKIDARIDHIFLFSSVSMSPNYGSTARARARLDLGLRFIWWMTTTLPAVSSSGILGVVIKVDREHSLINLLQWIQVADEALS